MDIRRRSKLIKLGLIFVLIISIGLSIYGLNKLSKNNSNNSKVSFQGSNNKGGLNEFRQNVPNGGSQGLPQNNFNSSRGSAPSTGRTGQMPAAGNFRSNGSKQNVPGMFQRGRMSQSSSSTYVYEITAYFAVFLVLSIGAYVIFKNRGFKAWSTNPKFLIPVLLFIGFFLRIFIGTIIEGHPSDLMLFKNWAQSAANNLTGVYSSSRSADYPPLYMYVLWLVGKLGGTVTLSSFYNILLKLPSIAADVVTSLIIYKLARKRLSFEISTVLSVFYLFNPAVLVNSSVWGQVDSFFTLILVAAIWMLSEGKLYISSIMFSAAVLMKPQGIIFLPVLFFELVRRKSIKEFLKSAALGIGTALVIILPFALTNGFTWIFKLYSNTVGEYPYATVNGFNFWALLGKNYVKDTDTFLGVSYHNLGMAFIVLVTLLSWVMYIKAKNMKFASAAALVQISGVFTFASSMHERYLFPALALAVLAYIYLKDKRILIAAGGFSITIFANTYYVLYNTLTGSNAAAYNIILIAISALNVVLFGYLLKIFYDNYKEYRRELN